MFGNCVKRVLLSYIKAQTKRSSLEGFKEEETFDPGLEDGLFLGEKEGEKNPRKKVIAREKDKDKREEE